MTVSDKDARESLAVIEDVMAQHRRSIAALASPYVILWGAIWVVGFAAVHVLGGLGGRIFLGLDIVGIAATIALGVTWSRRAPVRSPADRRMLLRIMWFWIAVFGYIWLSLAVMGTSDPLRCSAFGCIGIMFAYVVMGLWLDAPYLTWVGLGVTAMTILGFYALPRYFNLWLAFFGVAALGVLFGLEAVVPETPLTRLHLWWGSVPGLLAMGAFLIWRHPGAIGR